MRTKVTSRGQVSIPSAVRRQLRIKPESAVEWVVEGNTARVIPIPADPIGVLRGSGKKGEVARLIEDRRRDRKRDG